MPEVFGAIVKLALFFGHAPLSQTHPGRLCVMTIRGVEPSDEWTISLNGNSERVDGVPPFSARLDWNGWPAGIVDPAGGVIAHGTVANEDTFLEAAARTLGGRTWL